MKLRTVAWDGIPTPYLDVFAEIHRPAWDIGAYIIFLRGCSHSSNAVETCFTGV